MNLSSLTATPLKAVQAPLIARHSSCLQLCSGYIIISRCLHMLGLEEYEQAAHLGSGSGYPDYRFFSRRSRDCTSWPSRTASAFEVLRLSRVSFAMSYSTRMCMFPGAGNKVDCPFPNTKKALNRGDRSRFIGPGAMRNNWHWQLVCCDDNTMYMVKGARTVKISPQNCPLRASMLHFLLGLFIPHGLHLRLWKLVHALTMCERL